MGKYADFRYREDTYGQRIRREIDIRVHDYGYEVTATGETVANVVVRIGPMSWDPLGSQCPVCLADVGVYCIGTEGTHSERQRPVRVAVMRSYSFFPPDPDRLKFEQEAHLGDPSTQFLLYQDEGEAISGAVLTYRSGQEPLGVVRPGSILYLAVYVSELLEDPNGDVWLPWDLRGQTWAVIPNNYGGTQAAIDGMPRGVMTGGRLYAEHIMNPTTLFMKTMGYVLDMVVTDGELMIGSADAIHPNMVLPLLRGFGMDAEEEALFSDRTVRHRLKHVLAHYYEIRMMKGTLRGIERYIEAVTGLPAVVVGPVNLLLERSDTRPDNWLQGPRASVPADANIYSTESNATKWLSVPSEGYEVGDTLGLLTTPPASVRRPVQPFLTDGTTRDMWYDPKSPEPATSAIHYFEFTSSMTYGSRPELGCAAVINPGELYHFRFRFWPGVAPMTAYAELFFLDATGALMSTVRLPDRTGIYNDWNDYNPGNTSRAPVGARFIRWRITVTGSGNCRIGAIQLAPGGVPSLYRDPRAMAILLDTGRVPPVSIGATMDDPTAKMADTMVTMNDGVIVGGLASVDKYEQALIAKLKAVLPKYLPAGVAVEILTPDDVEFSRYSAGDSI